jgi:hypothetical protein
MQTSWKVKLSTLMPKINQILYKKHPNSSHIPSLHNTRRFSSPKCYRLFLKKIDFFTNFFASSNSLKQLKTLHVRHYDKDARRISITDYIIRFAYIAYYKKISAEFV